VAGLPESGHIEDQNKTTINSFSGYDPEFLSKNKEVNTVEVKQQSQTFCVMMAADTTNVSPPPSQLHSNFEQDKKLYSEYKI